MRKLSLDNYLYLAILLMPLNMTLSGLFWFFLLFKTLKIKYENLVPAYIKNTFYLFLAYSLMQGLFINHPLNHYAGLVGHYIVYILFFNIISKIIISEEQINKLINSLIYSGLILALSGIIIYFFSDINLKFFEYSLFGVKDYLIDINPDIYIDRSSGISMHPNIMAIYLVMILFLLLGKFKFSKIDITKTLIFFIQFICLILTRSRGAIIAMALIIPFILKNLKSKFIYLITFIAFLFFINDSKFMDRIITVFDTNYSQNFSRIFVWQKSLTMIKTNPLGIGILNFEETYKRLNIENYFHIPHAHNWYLQTIVESGIIGALLFFSFFISIIFYLFKNLSKKESYLPLCLISFLIFNLADYVLADIRITLILTVIIFIGFYKSKNPNLSDSK